MAAKPIRPIYHWRAMEERPQSSREAELRAITVGELKPLAGRVKIQEYDPA